MAVLRKLVVGALKQVGKEPADGADHKSQTQQRHARAGDARGGDVGLLHHEQAAEHEQAAVVAGGGFGEHGGQEAVDERGDDDEAGEQREGQAAQVRPHLPRRRHGAQVGGEHQRGGDGGAEKLHEIAGAPQQSEDAHGGVQQPEGESVGHQMHNERAVPSEVPPTLSEGLRGRLARWLATSGGGRPFAACRFGRRDFRRQWFPPKAEEQRRDGEGGQQQGRRAEGKPVGREGEDEVVRASAEHDRRGEPPGDGAGFQRSRSCDGSGEKEAAQDAADGAEQVHAGNGAAQHQLDAVAARRGDEHPAQRQRQCSGAGRGEARQGRGERDERP